MRGLFILLLLAINFTISTAQNPDMSAYNGEWESTIHPKFLSHELSISFIEANQYQLSITNYQTFYNEEITSSSVDFIDLKFADHFRFEGKLNEQKDAVTGVIRTRKIIYHVLLKKSNDGSFKGKWNMFYVDEINPGLLYLSVDGGEGEEYAAYPNFADNRFRGTYTVGFQKKSNKISFYDFNTGLEFKGLLLEDTILLDVYMGSSIITTLPFKRSTRERQIKTQALSPTKNIKNPILKDDGLEIGLFDDYSDKFSHLARMNDSIGVEALTHVHSVLIAKKGKLIYENYYNGFHSDIPHDTRSASKSLSSAAVGVGLQDGVLGKIDDSIYEYLPAEYQYTKDSLKEKITLWHLLTMSSGLDAIDFGIDRQGQATEDNYQQSDNWLKTVLEAPMIYEPGEHCYYGSANPYLLGIAMTEQLQEPLERYMDDKIYNPLGITNYSMFLDDRDDSYFGGGTYLLPRDMMKFGLLYANKGKWKGKQVLTEKWVEDSFKNYMALENTSEKNGYGYLFWHHEYKVKGKKINSLEARGAGGQNIIIIEDLDLVIVITSGNYRNGRYWQPQMIVEEYLLPAFVD